MNIINIFLIKKGEFKMKKISRLLSGLFAAGLAVAIGGAVAGMNAPDVSAASSAAAFTSSSASLASTNYSSSVYVKIGDFEYSVKNNKTAVCIGYVGSKKDFSTETFSVPTVIYTKDFPKDVLDSWYYVGYANSFDVVGLEAGGFSGLTVMRFALPRNLQYVLGSFRNTYIGGFLMLNSDNQYLSTDNQINALTSKDGSKLYYYPSKQTLYNTAYGSNVIIPASVKRIEKYAFSSCTLTTVDFPSRIEYVGYGSFEYSKFTKIIFEGSAPVFEAMPGPYNDHGTFNGASYLSSIIIRGKDGEYNTDGYGIVYNKDMTKLVLVPQNRQAAFPVADTCKEIGYYAFYKSKANPIIYGTVTKIDDFAFPQVNSNFKIWGLKNTKIETFASEHNIPFSETFSYTANSDNTGVTVTKYIGPANYFFLPDSVNGKPIKGIGEKAFMYNTSITYINMPDTINYIGDYAFYGCTKLSTVYLPSNSSDPITYIGKYAFYNTAIKGIYIPYGITKIDSYSFYGCPNLTSFTFAGSVNTIGSYAFGRCTALESIKIATHVKNIQAGAFFGCTSLKNVEIMNGVEVIGSFAFENTALTSQTLPKTVSGIYSNSFGYSYNSETKTHSRDSKFTKITGYPATAAHTYAKNNNITFDSIVQYNTTDDGTGIIITKFKGNDGEYSIPSYIDNKPVKEIASSAFSGNTTLIKIIIPNTVTKIGPNAFYNASDLSTISMPSTITEMGYYAFGKCTSLKYFYCPSDLKSIGFNAFDGCTSLSFVSLNSGLETIGNSAFINTGLLSITVPKSVTSIGAHAFGYKYTTNGFEPISGKFELIGYAYTKAESYANGNPSITFIPLYEPFHNTSTISEHTVTLGNSVTVNASSVGGKRPVVYMVEYSKYSSDNWKTVQNYSDNITIPVKLPAVGDFRVRVTAKDDRGYTEEYSFFVEVKKASELVNTSTISKTKVVLGSKATVSCSAEGGSGSYLYAVLYKKASVSSYSVRQNYSSNASVDIEFKAAVKYDVLVKVKDSNGKIAKKSFVVEVVKPLTNTSTISATTIKLGQKATVTGSATGGKSPYLYEVLYKKSSAANYSTAQSFSSNNVVDITPKTAVNYDILVKVKDQFGTIKKKSFTLSVKK